MHCFLSTLPEHEDLITLSRLHAWPSVGWYLSLCNKTIRLKRKVKKNKKTNSLKINWEIESKREKVILSFIESLFELWSSQKHATFIQILSLFRSERVTNFIYVKNTTSKYQLAVKNLNTDTWTIKRCNLSNLRFFFFFIIYRLQHDTHWFLSF